jgi:hypothetical protein
MKNKITDLRDHMFAALERLGNEELSKEDLDKEINRSRAISEVGKVIVESAKTEVMYAKLTGKKDAQPTKFLGLENSESEPETKKIERPPAVYDNHRPYEFAKDVKDQ